MSLLSLKGQDLEVWVYISIIPFLSYKIEFYINGPINHPSPAIWLATSQTYDSNDSAVLAFHSVLPVILLSTTSLPPSRQHKTKLA